MRSLLALSILACCSIFAAAQDAVQPARPRFEVAAIKRHSDVGPGQGIGVVPGGRTTVTGVPVRFMIRFAYNIQDAQISGGPAWMNTDAYDVSAQAPANVGLQAVRRYLQTLLEDCFQLVVHHETKEVPAYELVPAKSGLKVGPSQGGSCVVPDRNNPPKPGGPMPHFCGSIGYRTNSIEAYAVPMARFVATLSTVLGRKVIDKTGIQYNVDVHLEFTPEGINAGVPPAPGEPAPPAPDPSGPSIQTALQDQLGLRLVSAKAPENILVVDQLQRPTEN